MTAPAAPEQRAQTRRSLGQRLPSPRVAAGLTQAQLARLTGYARSTIANVETGRSTPPRNSQGHGTVAEFETHQSFAINLGRVRP